MNMVLSTTHATHSRLIWPVIVIFSFCFIGANFINFSNTETSFVPVANADEVLHTYTVTSKEVGGKYGDLPYLYYIDEEGNGGRTSVTTAQYAVTNVGDQFYELDLGTNYWVNFGNLVVWTFGTLFVLAVLAFLLFLAFAAVEYF